MDDLALDAFARRDEVQRLAAAIAVLAPPDRQLKLMHVCGSHEHALSVWGLRALLPPSVELIAGPGCPVCVCPEHEIREALALAEQGTLLATYGDMLRVPTRAGSLADAAARGAAVRLVYSPLDAVKLARQHPDRQVVFFAVGFETTAAPTAALVEAGLPPNLSVLTAHRLTPPAMVLLLRSGEIEVDGLIAPGHVSAIIGADAWACLSTEFGLPTVVAGFEPADVLLAVYRLLEQVVRGEGVLGNVYGRVVKPAGNTRATALLAEVFEVGTVWWRGLGELPDTGLVLREHFGPVDARRRFGLRLAPEADELPAGCRCHEVMLGRIQPEQCGLFHRVCHPLAPHGPCMVSQEGTCFIRHQFGGA